MLSENQKRHLLIWLCSLALLVVFMVVVGGVTRLTDSGLSMVEWRPLLGVFPPTTETAWLEVFEQYKQYPEYKLLNQGMSLGEFQFIYFWEYSHRLLGRLIGLVFILPFVFFWWRGYLHSRLRNQLLAGLCLGALQGVFGWYMVSSGLVDVPYVSHYRLAGHLCIAFLIEACLLWIIFELYTGRTVFRSNEARGVFRGTLLLTALVCIQIVFGAFVAGKNAGLAYNTFPLMNGEWVPSAVFQMDSLFANVFENPAAIQFIHRWLAFVVLAVLLLVTFSCWNKMSSRVRQAMGVVLMALVLQIGLGIATLVQAVPLSLAVMHQLGALLIVASMVYLLFSIRRAL